ncbi:hypothetical protein N7472_000950 [Penicillium cf. griseofulvum]|uniref:BZIP domain-containing protein n=1 Tax=Penicillium cf. griseofulvum TaxID=2972120 RepID=A0A9W9N0A8_9EURO|nr:hypothetical protein N7472_000950 [Penicillium cf. griseofulvum]KAJ5428362.1 hypothetical protein N7445_009816 [Penicillium cf. griseofulvum]
MASYFKIPMLDYEFTFNAPTDAAFTDHASTSTQPLFPSTLDASLNAPLDTSPDLGPQSFPDELMFDISSGFAPRENLNVSSSTVPTASLSASSSPSESSKDSSDRASKTRLNTLAARRYRQRRVNRTHELEAELEAIKQERDELKLRVSKLEGEANALKVLLRVQN